MKHGELIPNLLGVMSQVDRDALLERTEANGTKTPVLFWNIGGRLIVHPDRVDKFNSVVCWLVQRGGVDAMTDEARTKFGLGPRRPVMRLDVSPSIVDSIDDIVDAQRRHKNWLATSPFLNHGGVRP